MKRKAIILAGGSGTRLSPITKSVSKQLLPLFDKPMIYYPLSTVMLTGIKDVAVITNPDNITAFQKLLGTGEQWGMRFTFIEQPTPDGLAQAYILAEEFLDGSPSMLILGDNVFFGSNLHAMLQEASTQAVGGTVFGYQVQDPERYGVVGFDEEGRATSLVEKPSNPASQYAVTGLYFLDERAPERAKQIRPSARGELEITSLLNVYLGEGQLEVKKMGRGFAWLDTGTHESLLEAGNFVRTLQNRQGLLVGSPEEIAFNNGWITRAQFHMHLQSLLKTEYGEMLQNVLMSKLEK